MKSIFVLNICWSQVFTEMSVLDFFAGKRDNVVTIRNVDKCLYMLAM